jgi:hypothetical protein
VELKIIVYLKEGGIMGGRKVVINGWGIVKI